MVRRKVEKRAEYRCESLVAVKQDCLVNLGGTAIPCQNEGLWHSGDTRSPQVASRWLDWGALDKEDDHAAMLPRLTPNILPPIKVQPFETLKENEQPGPLFLSVAHGSHVAVA